MDYATFLILRDILETGSSQGDTSALLQAGLIAQDGKPTPAAQAAMEPYRVRRAVFTAAGIGTRAVPLTYDVPKGMIDVQGEYMIERQIVQLLEAGVDEIWMVLGHMHEGYRWLAGKYGVRFLTNPQYNSMNTIGSIFHALQLFDDNLYLLTVDIYLERNIFHSYEYRSWYTAPFAAGDTDEWCLTLDDNNLITDINIGGADSYIMCGPVFMAADFSRRLAELIPEYVADPARHYMYWEHIYMQHMDEMPMHALPMIDTSREFETLDDLRHWDTRYINDSGSRHMQAMAQALGCDEADISGIQPLKPGLFTRRFSFRAGGEYHHLYYDEDILPLLDGRGEADGIAPLEVPGSYIVKSGQPIANHDAAMCILRSFHNTQPATGQPGSLLLQLGRHIPIMSAFSFILDEEQAALANLCEPVRTHGAFCPENCLVTDRGVLLLENAFGCTGDRLSDVGFYCAKTGGDIAPLLAAYLERQPDASELERARIYAAAGALALFSRYSELARQGVDCNDLPQRYLELINKYS